jgi:hypothetical protein
MDRSDELDRLVGRIVFIRYMGSSNPSEEEINRLADEPGLKLTEQLLVASHYAILESYDQFGIIIRHPDEESNPFFLPWGAVLYIYSDPEQR